MNCFQLSFVIIILKVCLIVCLELKFLILFLFFFLSGGFNFTLSAMVSCDGNCINNGDDDDSGLNNLSEDIPFVGVLCLFFSI